MASRSTRTTPVGKYTLKRPKTRLTVEQYNDAHRLHDKISESRDAKNRGSLLAELRRCVYDYRKLLTFPKVGEDDEP